jgi:hypothetical protein
MQAPVASAGESRCLPDQRDGTLNMATSRIGNHLVPANTVPVLFREGPACTGIGEAELRGKEHPTRHLRP